MNTEQDYKIIFENSPNGIIYFNKFGIVISANKSALKIFSITREKLIGFDLLKDLKNQKLLHEITKSLKYGKAYYKGLYTSIYTNKQIYMEAHFEAIRDKNNDIISIVASLNDRSVESKAINKLIKSREEYKSIIDNMINLFIRTDKKGIIKTVSLSSYNILGYTPHEMIGKNILSFWKDKEKGKKLRTAYMKHLTPIKSIESVFLHKNGGSVILDFNVYPIFDKSGKLMGNDSIAKDITAIKKAQSTLELYGQIIEKTSEGIAITDKDNNIVYVNDAFCRITKYRKKEIIGKNPKILKSGIHNDIFYKQMWDHIGKNGFWKGEIWNKHKDNGIYPELLTINTITDKNNKVKNYIAIFHDISQIKETEAKIRHMAMHDTLTSLPNRAMLSTILKHSIDSAKRTHENVTVMFLDLDNFKMVNDNYGHTEGDKILIETASRLKGILREDDIVCRFGGDEFIMVLEHIKNGNDVANIANKINKALKQPFHTDKYTYYIGCSIGIAIFPNDAIMPNELIKKADTAMYDAKNKGKNRYSFYSNKLGKKISKELYIENLLRDSIKEKQFELYYQPKISLEDNQIVGLEALLRWNSPNGIVSPDVFIPIAERTGFISELGNWVLQTACAQVKMWQNMKIFDGVISVNISGAQLNNKDIIDVLDKTLKQSGLNAKYLNLELTESVLMSDPNQWKRLFDQVKKIGIDISIDDFGTGYSSLSYLRQLPIDELKIDKSFIDDIPNDKDACAIVKTIIALAQNLGYKTVAEGVETKQQKDYLKNNGCDIIQGYFYSKPLPVSEIEKYFTNFKS